MLHSNSKWLSTGLLVGMFAIFGVIALMLEAERGLCRSGFSVLRNSRHHQLARSLPQAGDDERLNARVRTRSPARPPGNRRGRHLELACQVALMNRVQPGSDPFDGGVLG